MMEEVCDILAGKFELFRQCRLWKTGSSFEGLKLTTPDEFDFMIDLPVLVDKRNARFEIHDLSNVSRWSVLYEITNAEIFRDLFPVSHCTVAKVSKYSSEIRSCWFRRIFDVIGDVLQTVLQPGWQMSPLNIIQKVTADHGKVYTFQLIWNGTTFKKLTVSVDVVLTIPFPRIPELREGSLTRIQAGRPTSIGTGLKSRNDESCPKPPSCQGQVSPHPGVEVVRVIMTTPGRTMARVTSSVEEQYLLEHTVSAPKKAVLRAAKMIRNKFLIQNYNVSTCSMDHVIPTYWLKTIWFYLTVKHPDDCCWLGDLNSGRRVLDIFDILTQALMLRKLSSFFVPGFNVLNATSVHSHREKANVNIQRLTRLVKELACSLRELHQGSSRSVKFAHRKIMLSKRHVATENRTREQDSTIFFAISLGRMTNRLLRDSVVGNQCEDELTELRAIAGDEKLYQEAMSTFLGVFLRRSMTVTNMGGIIELYHYGRLVNRNATYEDVQAGTYFIHQPPQMLMWYWVTSDKLHAKIVGKTLWQS